MNYSAPMKNLKILIFKLQIFILFTFSCGIEDTIYYEVPKNFRTQDGYNQENVILYFTANNQEQEGGEYLFIGYDVYYYFTDRNQARKVNVKSPFLNTNSQLINFSFEKLTNGQKRFIDLDDNKANEFYRFTTIPVTLDVITNVLTIDNNDNIIISFKNDPVNDSSGDTNPKRVINKLYMDNLYPNYDHYKDFRDDKTNLYFSNDPTFKGFYDKRFYDKLNIKYLESESIIGSYYIYVVYFYVKSKGFKSLNERKQSDYVESEITSNVVEVKFKILEN